MNTFASSIKGSQHGFTLIELMIVVLIIAILAAIAYPSFQHAVRESRRAPAKTALLDLAGREERYYSTNNVYSSDLAVQLGYGVTPVQLPDANTGYYAMTVGITPDHLTFTATATAQGDQALDPCGSFVLNNQGLKTTTGGSLSASDCWK